MTLQRELIFDTTIPERPTPRVWQSAYDVPRGTVCTNNRDSDRVYITTRGTGWWINPGESIEENIAAVEEGGGGWDLDVADRYAPLTEVIR